MVTAISAILVFSLMIFFHELGHFTVAKLMKVEVYEFSIGFGPKIYGFTKGETFYNLRALPLGGFVRMAGMDPDEDEREIEKRKELLPGAREEDLEIASEKKFINKSVLQRVAVIAAGPIMNFVLAIILFAGMYAYMGLPTTEIRETVPDKPAEQVGIQPGDRIISVNENKVGSWEEMVAIIHKNPNKEIKLIVERNDKEKTFFLIPEKDKENNVGIIGIYPSFERPGLFKAASLGVTHTYNMLTLTFDFLGKMFAKEVPVELSGPVRITMELGKAAEMGILTLVQFAGFLSIQIGLFNLFPIPALDGSRIVFLIIEGLRGRPVDPSKENFIHLVGLALLLLLMVVITYKDILHIVS